MRTIFNPNKQSEAIGHDLAMNLRSAYLAMHRAVNACFSESGLSADSFTLLTALAQNGPMAQKYLVEILNSDANTISAMLTRLERDKIIIRKSDENDKRKHIIHLTKQGVDLQLKMWNKSQNIRNDLETLFKDHDRQSIIDSLSKISQAMLVFQKQ